MSTEEIKEQVKEAAEAAATKAEAVVKSGVARNPWPWIVGALIVGFIAGAVLL